MNITSNKSLSRLAAVQTLFQFDFNKKMKLEELKSINDMDISEIYQTIENINSNTQEFKNLKIDKNWFLILVNAVFSNKDIIDASLSSFLESNWSIERMDPTITNILRCAYIEFKNYSNAIQEAGLGRLIINSLIISTSATFLNILLSF